MYIGTSFYSKIAVGKRGGKKKKEREANFRGSRSRFLHLIGSEVPVREKGEGRGRWHLSLIFGILVYYITLKRGGG